MLKRMKKSKKPLNIEPLKNAAGGLRDIFVVAASHPAAAALAIMATTVSLKLLSGSFKNTAQWHGKFNGELTGLYNGAQTVGLTCAVVPVVSSGVGAITQALALKKPS